VTQSSHRLVELILEHATLYHGSATSGITELHRAEEDTVGAGVYLAEEATARAYALHRAGGSGTPVMYQVGIDKARLVDLTDQHTVDAVMTGFVPILQAELVRASRSNDPWYTIESLRQTIADIGEHGAQATNLKAVTQRSGALFTRYLRGSGYDGLVALEGGEGGMGNHRTYLLFDPARLRIESEHHVGAGAAAGIVTSAAPAGAARAQQVNSGSIPDSTHTVAQGRRALRRAAANGELTGRHEPHTPTHRQGTAADRQGERER
jgi:hypothetical protein